MLIMRFKNTHLNGHSIFLLSHLTKVLTPVLIILILVSFFETISFTIGETR